MLKLIALASAAALAAGGALAHPAPPPGAHEMMVCKMKGPGDAEAKEVPCGTMDHGGPGMHMMEHGPGMGGPGHHGFMMRMHGGPEGLDANKDGRVTFEEFAAPMREHFNELDKNKSGALEKDEMPGDHMIIEKRIEKHD
ncbi:MAG: hypothetical protein ACXWVJ_07740 [Caulobacteraceae bacterium]